MNRHTQIPSSAQKIMDPHLDLVFSNKTRTPLTEKAEDTGASNHGEMDKPREIVDTT